MIPLPQPDAVLYPRDKVLLMGTTDQVNAGRQFLAGVSGASFSSAHGAIENGATSRCSSRNATGARCPPSFVRFA